MSKWTAVQDRDFFLMINCAAYSSVTDFFYSNSFCFVTKPFFILQAEVWSPDTHSNNMKTFITLQTAPPGRHYIAAWLLMTCEKPSSSSSSSFPSLSLPAALNEQHAARTLGLLREHQSTLHTWLSHSQRPADAAKLLSANLHPLTNSRVCFCPH